MSQVKEKKKSIVNIAFWYLLGDLLVKGLSVLTTPIFSRILTKQEYGEFSNFTSWEGILLVIVTLDLATTVSRAKYDFDEHINEYISSIVAVSNVFTIIIYIIIELNADFFMKLFSMDMFSIRLLFVYFMFEPAYSYMQIKHRMYMKYKFFIFFSVVSALLRTGVSLFLVYFTQDKLQGRIIGYIVPAILLNFCIYIYVYKKGHTVRWKYCKYALAIGVPLIPHTLANNLLANSDRIMITNYCGAEKTAIYSLAYTIASMVILIRTSLNKVWTPWFFDALNDKKYGVIKARVTQYVVVFIGMIIGLMLLAPELVLIFGGNEYYEARYVIPPVMGGLVCQFIYTLYVNIEIYEKKTFMISVGTILASGVNIALNIILIPRLGYKAAAYTTFVGYVALVIFHFLLVKIVLHKEYIFDNGFFVKSLSVFLIAQIICTWLYSHMMMRYIVLFLYAISIFVLLWSRRKELIEMFRK